MINLTSWMRSERKSLGLSQAALAQLSGLSLPLIQKIEAGQGNPSLQSMEALSDALGFRLNLLRNKAPWDALIHHGAALSTLFHKKWHTSRTQKSLIHCIFLCLREIEDKEIPVEERKKEALFALILAIKAAYPSLWENSLAKKIPAKLLPPRLNGRLLKLKRISTTHLSEYL